VRPCILERPRHTPRQGVMQMFRSALMLLAVGCLAHEARVQVLNMEMLGRLWALFPGTHRPADRWR
jgi:hypothetical protein